MRLKPMLSMLPTSKPKPLTKTNYNNSMQWFNTSTKNSKIYKNLKNNKKTLTLNQFSHCPKCPLKNSFSPMPQKSRLKKIITHPVIMRKKLKKPGLPWMRWMIRWRVGKKNGMTKNLKWSDKFKKWKTKLITLDFWKISSKASKPNSEILKINSAIMPKTNLKRPLKATIPRETLSNVNQFSTWSLTRRLTSKFSKLQNTQSTTIPKTKTKKTILVSQLNTPINKPNRTHSIKESKSKLICFIWNWTHLKFLSKNLKIYFQTAGNKSTKTTV